MAYEKNTLINDAPKITQNSSGKYQAEIQVYARNSSYQVSRNRGVELGDVEYTVKLIPTGRDYSLQTIVVELKDHSGSDYMQQIEVDFNDDTSTAYRVSGPKRKTKVILKEHNDPDSYEAPESNSVTKVEKSIGHQGLVEVRVEVYAAPSASENVKIFSNIESDGSKTYSLHLQPDSNLGYERLQTYLVLTDWTSMSQYSDVSVIFNGG